MANKNAKNEMKSAADPLSLQYGSSQPGQPVLKTPSQRAAEGNQSEPETVQMEALSERSYGGKTYQVGETFDVPVEHVEALTLSGFAARVDRAEVAAQQRQFRTATTEAGRQAGNTQAEPMKATTDASVARDSVSGEPAPAATNTATGKGEPSTQPPQK